MMIAITAIGSLLNSLLGLFLYALLARIIIEYVMMFSRTWQPKGFVLALVDLVFRITDPPMRFVRRYIPPLRVGQVSFDVGFLVLFFGVQVLMGLTRAL